MWPPGAMAGVEDQNPASWRRVWSGKVRGSCLGLPRVPFRWLDGLERGSAMTSGDGGGGAPASAPKPVATQCLQSSRCTRCLGGSVGRCWSGWCSVMRRGRASSSALYYGEAAERTRQPQLGSVRRRPRERGTGCGDPGAVSSRVGNQLAWPTASHRRHKTVSTAPHGTWRKAAWSASPGHGAWPTGLRSPPGLRGPARISRGVRTPEGANGDAWQAVEARAHDARARWRQRPAPILFGLRVFKNVELTFLVLNLKISKNESCRATIGLQLSQRATYVLINGLSGNVGRSWQNSRLELPFTARATRFLANLHSKLECPPITKNMFPEITNNFRIGRFWTSIVKFGERARKPNQPFWDLWFWPRFGDFDQGLLCKCVPTHVKHV
jgi:hypothetical protein